MKHRLISFSLLLIVAAVTTTAQPVPNMPSDGATDQPIDVTLGWRPLSAVVAYEVEYGTDPAFEDVEGIVTEESETVAANLLYSTLYIWRVRGLDIEGNPATDWSAVRTFTTKPDRGIPQPVSPTDGATDQPTIVSLVWSSVEGGSQYEVEYAYDPDFLGGVRVPTSGTAYTLSGLDFEQTIFWRVRSTAVGAGPGEWSRYVSFTTAYRKPDPLAVPRLSAPANGSGGHGSLVELKWGDVSGEGVRYHVEVATDAAFDSLRYTFGDLDSLSVQPDALDQGRTYFWRAKAYNDETESSWTDVWSFSTAADTTVGLFAPELLTPIDNAQQLPVDLLLTWDSVEGAIFYEVVLGRDETFGQIDTLLTVDSTAVGISGLLADATYFWRARGGHSAAMSGWSKPFRFSTESEEAKLPETPILLLPADSASDLEGPITLVWESASYAAQYFVQLSATGDFNGEEEEIVQTGENVTVDELKPGVRHFWRVQGVNQFGESGWSEVRSFVTKDESSAVEEDSRIVAGLRIYPVPATDLLHIDLGPDIIGEVRVEVLNGLGESIPTGIGERLSGGDRIVTVSLQGLPSGMFFCRLSMKDRVITRPVLVLR